MTQALNLFKSHKEATEISVLDCKFHPSDIDRFIVGTDSGQILNESRFRTRCHPRTYNLQDSNYGMIDGATSLEFCPHDDRLFIAGYMSGMVGLFSVKERKAVVTWNASSHPIRLVRWSPQRPAVFFVLDHHGILNIWDLSESEAEPAHVVQTGDKGIGGNRLLVTFALSPTMSSAALSGSQATLAAAASKNATMLFGFADGTSEVHLLDQILAEQAIDEERALAVYTDGIGLRADETADDIYDNANLE